MPAGRRTGVLFRLLRAVRFPDHRPSRNSTNFSANLLTVFRREAAMTAIHRHWTSLAGAIALAVIQAQTATAAPAPTAVAPAANRALDNSELLVRLQRLERDMRDLEAATFRKPPADKSSAPIKDADLPVVAEPPPPPAVMPDLNP